MIRRVAKPAVVLLTIASVVLIAPPQSLDAVTANLNTLIQTDGAITEGDKTFSNFSFTPIPLSVSSQGGVLVLPAASDVTVSTSTGPGGAINLSFGLNMSASVGGGSSDFTGGLVDFGFDVNVTGSDVISAVSIAATGVVQQGPLASAGAAANLSSGDFITTRGIGTAAIPGLQALTVDAIADVLVEGLTETAALDDVVFTFEQTTPSSSVPEPGSLTLIAGGLGMVLVRTLYRRRA